MNTTVCECEKSQSTDRIRCFESAVKEFYKARCMVFELQELNFKNIQHVSEITLDHNIGEKPILAQIGESLVLRHFLEDYSQKHPRFAQETQSVNNIHTRMFKDI